MQGGTGVVHSGHLGLRPKDDSQALLLWEVTGLVALREAGSAGVAAHDYA